MPDGWRTISQGRRDAPLALGDLLGGTEDVNLGNVADVGPDREARLGDLLGVDDAPDGTGRRVDRVERLEDLLRRADCTRCV